MANLTGTFFNPLNRKLQLYSTIPANSSCSADQDYIAIAARMTRIFLLLYSLDPFFLEVLYLSSDTCHKQLKCKSFLSLTPSASHDIYTFYS